MRVFNTATLRTVPKGVSPFWQVQHPVVRRRVHNERKNGLKHPNKRRYAEAALLTAAIAGMRPGMPASLATPDITTGAG
jgi:hypothetical protein